MAGASDGVVEGIVAVYGGTRAGGEVLDGGGRAVDHLC
jgi:hypothetical protein